MATIGIDVDGVLAQFNPSYVPLLRDCAGRDLFGDIDWSVFPPCWNYHIEAGYTDKEIAESWAVIGSSPSFWGALLPSSGDMYSILSVFSRLRYQGHAIYFVTDRPGRTAKLQTEKWLQAYGMENPTVIISKNKALYALDLKMDVYVDDRIENAHDVLWAAQEDKRDMRVYLTEMPYNRVERDPGLIVVPDIKGVLEAEGWR